MNCRDEFYPPIELQLKYCTATVHRPILTKEERERRMERIKRVFGELCLAAEETSGGRNYE